MLRCAQDDEAQRQTRLWCVEARVSVQPKIRYAKSADGTNIAYWAIGEGGGTPLVYAPTMPWSHIEREWGIPEWRRRYERLAAGRRLVRYDPRGFGLSERHPVNATAAAHGDDIEAVLDALAVDDCDLLAIGDGGFGAIEYSARANSRVRQLILWGAYANRDILLDSPKIKSMHALWDEDWTQYTELAIRTALGWKHEDRARQLAEFYREAASPESLRSIVGAMYGVDLGDLLPLIKVPTLVVALEDSWIDVREEARRLAACLPNAELRSVRGETALFDFYDEEDAVVTIVNEFLGGGEGDPSPSPSPKGEGSRAGVTTVLFTDIVGHTEMMSRLGDARGREVLREHERITREVLAAHGGAEVKTMGDGFMASFASVTASVECAIALQKALTPRPPFPHREGGSSERGGGGDDSERGGAEAPLVQDSPQGPERIAIRVGLNAGEPIEEEGPDGRADLFGATVILASRICGMAGAGEILVPETVRGLLSGKNFLFSDRGEFVPKGFDDAVRLYEVRWQEEGA